MPSDNNFILALSLSLMAGLSTGLGGIIILFTRKFSSKYLSAALGFSAGVMIFISLTEIFGESQNSLTALHGDKLGFLYSILSFFGGIAIIAVIDHLIPSKENPHELYPIKEGEDVSRLPRKKEHISPNDKGRLLRLGIFSCIAIAIHNFPEGMATFASTINNPDIGITVAIAIAIHNIPEGIMVAIPIYYATRKKSKAIGNALLSGLAEPIGGLLGYLLFSRIFQGSFNGVILGMVAGIMIYISLDELLPTAEKYGEHHISIIGVVAGMAVMAFSLFLMN
ncbi:MAG TPA: zinc transporter ZupT [Candidatus Coprenecus stercoripullorum]|nr:zinc transporter ZupT [Candidatus Coprenecus stercoripullorum]